jgi:quercetin dioxygenase-like cupin family protein
LVWSRQISIEKSFFFWGRLFTGRSGLGFSKAFERMSWRPPAARKGRLPTVRFLLTADDSSGSIAAFEVTVPGAQRLLAPAHSHDHYEETIYGIDGVLTWTVDGRQIKVGPGQALRIPRGTVHRFDNPGSQDVKALCVITPAALGPQYFRECAEVIDATAGGQRRFESKPPAGFGLHVRPHRGQLSGQLST